MKKKKNIDTLDNSLGQAIGFPEMPFGSPIAGSEQTSDPMTMFKNLRWYLLSNFRQVLSQLYVEIGLVKTLVDVPVDDAVQRFPEGR